MKLIDLVAGWFGSYARSTNEMELVATDDDPAGLRGGKTWRSGRGWNLFKISGNIVRDDGVHEEYGLIRFRLAPNEREGAIECVVRNEQGGETAIFYADAHGVHFGVPVHFPRRRIALQAEANGKLVCAEGAGNQPLIANRTDVGQWETFEEIEVS